MDDYQRTIFTRTKLVGHAKNYWNNSLTEERFGRKLMTWVKMNEMLRAKYCPKKHDKKFHMQLISLN